MNERGRMLFGVQRRQRSFLPREIREMGDYICVLPERYVGITLWQKKAFKEGEMKQARNLQSLYGNVQGPSVVISTMAKEIMKQGVEVLGGLRKKFIQISGIEFARNWYLRHLLCARHLMPLLSFNPHGSNPVRQKYHPHFILEQAKAQR